MSTIDIGDMHEVKIREKNLPCPPLSGYNHIAVFVKWAYKKGMLSEDVFEKEPRLKSALEGEGDIREVLNASPFFKGRICTEHFKDEYLPFIQHYYSFYDEDRYTYWVDDNAREYFKAREIDTAQFKHEAYLGVPYGDDNYTYLTDRLEKAWNNGSPDLGGSRDYLKYTVDDLYDIRKTENTNPGPQEVQNSEEPGAAAKESPSYPKWPENTIDNREIHEKKAAQRGVTLPPLAQYNLMAIFLKWAYGKGFITGETFEKEPALKECLDKDEGLRELIEESSFFNGCITTDMFVEEVHPFAEGLYKYGSYKCYPNWADSYARDYLGDEKWRENYFYYVAYLFNPYDDDYCRHMTDKLDEAWNNRTPRLKGETVGTEILEDLVREVWDKTKTDTVRMELHVGETTLTSSKIGGLPYWPKDKDFISFSDGMDPLLLAQINLSDFKQEKFPDHGLLQFFIPADDDLGLESQCIKVVYHETIDETVTEEDVEKRGILPGVDDEDYCMFPVRGSYPITFENAVECKNTWDREVTDIIEDLLKDKYHFELGENDMWDYLTKDDTEFVESKLSKGITHMLGHAYFTQEDPREYDEKLERYDTLLFQLDSVYDDDIDVQIGDAGIINFFINHEDLEKKNFDDVLFNWDCC